MENALDRVVIKRIMDRAVEIHKQCPDECRDFRIMVSPMREATLILRWLTIDISDLDRPTQCFHYECFNLDGSSQNCSVNYSSQEEANQFFFGLETIYSQNFASDHIEMNKNVPHR